MRYIFTVDFDPAAWDTLTEDERQDWYGDVLDAINEHAYVSNVSREGRNARDASQPLHRA